MVPERPARRLEASNPSRPSGGRNPRSRETALTEPSPRDRLASASEFVPGEIPPTASQAAEATREAADDASAAPALLSGTGPLEGGGTPGTSIEDHDSPGPPADSGLRTAVAAGGGLSGRRTDLGLLEKSDSEEPFIGLALPGGPRALGEADALGSSPSGEFPAAPPDPEAVPSLAIPQAASWDGPAFALHGSAIVEGSAPAVVVDRTPPAAMVGSLVPERDRETAAVAQTTPRNEPGPGRSHRNGGRLAALSEPSAAGELSFAGELWPRTGSPEPGFLSQAPGIDSENFTGRPIPGKVEGADVGAGRPQGGLSAPASPAAGMREGGHAAGCPPPQTGQPTLEAALRGYDGERAQAIGESTGSQAEGPAREAPPSAAPTGAPEQAPAAPFSLAARPGAAPPGDSPQNAARRAAPAAQSAAPPADTPTPVAPTRSPTLAVRIEPPVGIQAAPSRPAAPVDVIFQQRGQELNFTVRSADSSLAIELQRSLPELRHRLDGEGFETRLWINPERSSGPPLVAETTDAGRLPQDAARDGGSRRNGWEQPPSGSEKRQARQDSKAGASEEPPGLVWLTELARQSSAGRIVSTRWR